MNDQVPAYIANKQRDSNATSLARRGLQNVGIGSPPRISIAGGAFTAIDSGGQQMLLPNPLRAVVVDINDAVSKIWFGANYNPSDEQPPLCWSDNGIGPSVHSQEPQCDTCDACEFNKWGSKVNQFNNEVKECADKQKIVVIIPGLAGYEFVVQIPGGSFKNWRGYLARFDGGGVDVEDVVTLIGFEPGKTGVLMFTGEGYLDAPTLTHRDSVFGGTKLNALIGRTDRAIAPGTVPPGSTPGSTHHALAAPQNVGTGQPTQFGQMQQVAPQQGQAPKRRGRGRTAAAPAPQIGQQAPFMQQQPQAPQQGFQQPQQPQGAPQGGFQQAAPPQQPFQPAAFQGGAGGGPAGPVQEVIPPGQPMPQTSQQPQFAQPTGGFGNPNNGPAFGQAAPAFGAQQQPGTFGMAAGQAPPSDMQRAIAGIFGGK